MCDFYILYIFLMQFMNIWGLKQPFHSPLQWISTPASGIVEILDEDDEGLRLPGGVKYG